MIIKVGSCLILGVTTTVRENFFLLQHKMSARCNFSINPNCIGVEGKIEQRDAKQMTLLDTALSHDKDQKF